MKSPAPTSPPAADRNGYIDALRGWSIFGVVCIHFAGSFVTTDKFAWSPSFYLGFLLNQVFIFAVPLFIFLSGLLAGRSKSRSTLAEYYRGRFWRIAFPYLIVSALSFFLLNHYVAWRALPNDWQRFTWLLQHVFYTGVEPTLYFIPLILMLAVLQPALKALPDWLNRLAPAVSPDRWVLMITGLLLALHVVIGVLCFRGTLNYYFWGRPDPLFWGFYFFAGLHFRSLAGFVSTSVVRRGSWIAFAIAAAALIWNFQRHTDLAVVGVRFELNDLDSAYARPEMLVYDLAVVAGLAAGIALGWNSRGGVFAYLGRYTLEIYLWHILLLYYGAWRYQDAMDSCREMPELILVICALATVILAGLADAWGRLRNFVRHHRLALVRLD